MSKMVGDFSLPVPNKTSQLENDSHFTSVKEYTLSYTSLSDTSTYAITDLPVGKKLVKTEVIVNTAFVTSTQGNLSITGDNSAVILNQGYNDPNVVGNYINDCNYTVTANGVTVNHNLGSATAGSLVLRLHLID